MTTIINIDNGAQLKRKLQTAKLENNLEWDFFENKSEELLVDIEDKSFILYFNSELNFTNKLSYTYFIAILDIYENQLKIKIVFKPFLFYMVFILCVMLILAFFLHFDVFMLLVLYFSIALFFLGINLIKARKFFLEKVIQFITHLDFQDEGK
jgi:hypothetical protein